MGTYALTGGATGIGAAIKNRLLEDGHKLIVADIKDADLIADLSSIDGRRAAIDGFVRLAPDGLDGLITCAGLGPHTEDQALIAGVNYFGSTELIEGLRDLLSARKGAVVLVSSNSAPMPTDDDFVNFLTSGDETAARQKADEIHGQQVYSGTKLAVARWMRANSAGFAAEGVRLNAVAPGYIGTPMTHAIEKDPELGEAIRQFTATIPIGRPGTPEDIAGVVRFMLGDDARYMCGSLIFVDGGHDAMFRPDSI